LLGLLLLALHLGLLLQFLFVVLGQHFQGETRRFLTVDRRRAVLIIAHFFGGDVLAAGRGSLDVPAILTSLVLNVDNIHIRLAQARVGL
jgi:hypothetical protein